MTTISESLDRKSTRLNSSHQIISYAVFCLKKKRQRRIHAGAGNSAASPRSRSRAVQAGKDGHLRRGRRTRRRGDCRRVSYFFLNNRGPPESYTFPLPAAFPF